MIQTIGVRQSSLDHALYPHGQVVHVRLSMHANLHLQLPAVRLQGMQECRWDQVYVRN
jgi:hypothetical protein